MNNPKTDSNRHFKDILKGRVVIVGVGNILRGDDGFGPALVERLMERGAGVAPSNLKCVDAGVSPENYMGKISGEKPDTILIVDAMHLGLRPGEYEILDSDEICKSGIATHDISPAMFARLLKDRTNASIYMLGVQPLRMGLGDEMSDDAKKTLAEISARLKEAISA